MYRAEITYNNKHGNKIVKVKNSGEAKKLYDFVAEYSSELLDDNTLPSYEFESYVADEFIILKDSNNKLYKKYQADIDGVIDLTNSMYYQDNMENDGYVEEILEILIDTIDVVLDKYDDLTNEVMKYLSSLNIGLKYTNINKNKTIDNVDTLW